MVEDEKIEQLLRAAMAAPSAGNQQPWEFYVVRDKRVIHHQLHSAHLLAVNGSGNALFKVDGHIGRFQYTNS